MHDGMPYGRNQGQGHSREVDRQSPTGLIFIILSLSVLMAILQVNLGQPVFTEAKDDGSGGDSWSYRSCKAPVKSSPPTNQHQVFFTSRMHVLSPNQQCQSTEGKNITFHGLAYPKLIQLIHLFGVLVLRYNGEKLTKNVSYCCI